ncbi:MAG TPA: Fe-S cluster assembly protein SufD [Solirubrobacteraceae bacterium]|nr:Fe-S cluster assembly protein SufD [Solirubrobacteraceae bacterium]
MAEATVPAADWRTLELPNHKGTPGWEFTELRKFDLASFPKADATPASIEIPEPVLPAPDGSIVITQVDGAWEKVPAVGTAGPIVMPLSQAVEEHGALVDQYLGTVVDDADPFVARNAAEWDGGAFVYVPRNQTLAAPVVLNAIQAQQGSALNWRVLVVLEEGAQAEVWEQQLAATDGLVNVVFELVVGQNANLRFLSAQDLDEKSWVFGRQRARVGRDGTLDWVVLGFGSANGKVFQNTILDGEGATGKVTGAYATRGRQHLDFDTTQEHAAANCVSDLAFRGILSDRSSVVWRGMIKVDPGAQQTDAFQESRNLLLSKKAHADAIPGLEILANDVRCTHAAAIAQIDPEQLFYLRSRGLSQESAERLVVEGFLAELVERFEEGTVRDALAAALERRLGTVLGD